MLSYFQIIIETDAKKLLVHNFDPIIIKIVDFFINSLLFGQ